MMTRPAEDLVDSRDPALPLIREWISQGSQPCEVLAPSNRRSEVLQHLQVTTRSPLGALAYETGGLLIQNGWLRFLGSGHERLSRDLRSWNEDRANGFFLVGDDAVGGFFALNGGGLGEDLHTVYYWAPDDLDWLALGMTFTDLLQSALSERLDEFYESLRWRTWQKDVATLGGDQSFAFYPFLWTKEGSLESSDRRAVPTSEVFDLKVSILRQLGPGG
jgi:hypothetical protein